MPEKAGTIYRNAVIFSIPQSLALIVIGLLVIPLVLKGEFAHVISLSLIYLISIPLSLIAEIHTGILQGLLWMKRHSLQRILPAMFYTLGLLALFGYGEQRFEYLVVLLLLTLFVSSLLGFGLIRETSSQGFWLKREFMKKMLAFGLKTQAADAAQALNFRLDQLVISIFLSPENLGYYVVAVTLAGLVVPLSNAIGIVILPDMASTAVDDQVHRLAAILRKSFLVLPALSVVLIASIPWLLPMFFGASFRPTVLPAQILLVGSVFLGMSHVLAEGLRGINRHDIPIMAEIFSLIATVLLLYLLLPRYGITGAAVASVIAYATTFFIMVFYMVTRAGLKYRALFPTVADWKTLWGVMSFQDWRRKGVSDILRA
jgi:O-antigen/teichoic acid export membrane protein